MRSHSRAIHNNKAIPSRIIPSRVTDNSKATSSKVMPNKVMHNSKAILNKDIPNSNTTSHRVMDNHNRQILPEKVLRPKKRRP